MEHTQPPSLFLTLGWTTCPIHLMELKSALILSCSKLKNTQPK